MIDIEAEVFDKVYKALLAVNSQISMSSAFVAAPAGFPAVSLIEISNVPHKASMTQESHEAFASISYEVNVYSDKANGRKKEAKQLAEVVNNTMCRMGFVRSLYTPVPNFADGAIFRLTMRFIAVVGTDHKIYRL